MFIAKPPLDPKLRPPRSHHLLIWPTVGGLTLISGGCYAFVFLDLWRGLVPLLVGVGLLAVVFRAWFRSQPDVDRGNATPTVIDMPGLKITMDPRTIDEASKELVRMALNAKREEPHSPDGSTGGTSPPPALLEDDSRSHGDRRDTVDGDATEQQPKTPKAKVIRWSEVKRPR